MGLRLSLGLEVGFEIDPKNWDFVLGLAWLGLGLEMDGQAFKPNQTKPKKIETETLYNNI